MKRIFFVISYILIVANINSSELNTFEVNKKDKIQQFIIKILDFMLEAELLSQANKEILRKGRENDISPELISWVEEDISDLDEAEFNQFFDDILLNGFSDDDKKTLTEVILEFEAEDKDN